MADAPRTWTSRSLASGFCHSIFYTAIRFTGHRVAYFMLFFVAGFYTLIPAVRKRSAPYRQRVWPDSTGIKSVWHSFRLYYSMGLMLVDRAVMGILGTFRMDADAKDKALLQQLLVRKRGLVLVTAHVGCWQVGTAALDFLEAPKAVLMFRDDQDVDRLHHEHQRAEKQETTQEPPRIIDPRSAMGSALEMMDVLKNNGVLCVMGDREFGSQKSTVAVDFLGGTIHVPYSVYRIASALGSPVVVTFSRRTGPGCGVFWVDEVLDIPEHGGKSPALYQPVAQRFARCMERYVNEAPLQFFNFYNLWR